MFQNDHTIGPPMTSWKPREKVLHGPHMISAPRDGVFDIMIGLLDPAFQRVPMLGQESGNLRYHIGTLTVSSQGISSAEASEGSDPRLFFSQNDGEYSHAIQIDRFIKSTYEILSPLNRVTAHVPMMSHEFLPPEHNVERSRFGETTITVNYGSQPFSAGDAVLPRYGFLVESPLLVAFYATKYSGHNFSEPTMLAVQSLDGRPLSVSSSMEKYRAFGEHTVKIAGRLFDFEADAKPSER